jgi:hypothetical protein
MPLQTPSTPRIDIAIVSHCWTMVMQDFKPRKATTRDSCQPSSAIARQRRTPPSPKDHKKQHRPSSASAGLEQMQFSQLRTPQETTTNPRQPLLNSECAVFQASDTKKASKITIVSRCWTKVHAGLGKRQVPADIHRQPVLDKGVCS